MTRGWGAHLCGAGKIGFFAVCALLAVADVTLAQDAGSLSGRLERVERDLVVLQRQAYREQSSGGEGAMTSEGTASLFVRISQLEEQMRDLTGQIEELSHRIDVNSQRMDRMAADADFRFQALEKGGASAEPPTPAQQSSGPAVTTDLAQSSGKSIAQSSAPVQLRPPPTNAEDAYREAFRLLQKADYAAAETAFKAFLKDHSDTEFAGNAQYWLGETYYVRGQFEPAAIAFADGYKKYRKGTKAPDSLLKLGFSMRKLNQPEKACAALDQLLKEYPNVPKVQSDLARKTRGEIKCR
jgi:tol-pal system protein YbgF